MNTEINTRKQYKSSRLKKSLKYFTQKITKYKFFSSIYETFSKRPYIGNDGVYNKSKKI